jgi:hypothetical protein
MNNKIKSTKNFNFKRKAVFLIILLIPLFLLSITCSAQINAEDYAPILYYEGEETCYPVEAEYHIKNSNLETIDIQGTIVSYYDNSHGTITDNGVINHYNSQSRDVKVYYRYFPDDTNPTAIQYWMFYAFNKGDLNQHEGDWEMVQIVFENGEPSSVGYSQHHSGQRATWDQVERDGNHIKVYVACGSHANYLRSYSGKLGIASDIVGDNGRVIRLGSGELEELDSQDWLEFEGLWGEINGAEDFALGQAGPQGPQFREDGNMWNNPVSWGQSISPASDLMFILEWIIYNLVLIYIIITVAIIALMMFFIYRRYKKYGLGPRIVSMFYINGINLHSIGNILCIVGIVIAFIGLFNPWYHISYNVTGETAGTLQTEGVVELIKLDGLNGLQIIRPGTTGPVPMTTIDIPFSLFIAVGLVFLIIATIGIPLSIKLGKKYIFRGIRLIIPFILLLVMVMALGNIAVPDASGSVDTTYVEDILGPITESPLGGDSSTVLPTESGDIKIDLSWGFLNGIWWLFIAGIILIISGIFEILSNSTFYQTKTPFPGQPLPIPAPMAPQVAQQQSQPVKKSEESKTKTNFCPECGKKIEENAVFCLECGKKIK